MIHLSDELLNEYLDNVIADHAAAEKHIAECADCAERLATLRALFTELDSLPEATLSRDLTAPVLLKVRRPGFLPRWLTLTMILQAALALIAIIITAPLVVEFASASMPVVQAPSITETIVEVQGQWMTWLEALSQFEMPSIPEVPAIEVSSMYALLTLAAISMFWLVGNGLLLRNQIK